MLGDCATNKKGYKRGYKKAYEEAKKKYNLLYIASLAVLLYLFQSLAEYLGVARSLITQAILITILLLFNLIWDSAHCGGKESDGAEGI
ncbi:MAG: hypothetical protein ACLT3H_01015 [Roseburia sp.]